MDATETLADRGAIRDRFFAEFGIYQDAVIAPRLGVAARSVRRWRRGQAVPQPPVARRMAELLVEGRHVLAVGEAELAQLGEAARQREELAQARIRVTEAPVATDQSPPSYYAEALGLIRAERWREAEAMLRHWSIPGVAGGFDQVPDPLRPHLLQSYGLCLYYLGRRAEAGDVWRRGLALAEHGRAPRDLVHGLMLLVGNSLWRQRRFADAFQAYDLLIQRAPDFPFTYHNALCCADAARDPQLLAKWIGATEVAVLSHFTVAVIDEMMQRLADDNDLRWARTNPLWDPFIDSLREARAAMARQLQSSIPGTAHRLQDSY